MLVKASYAHDAEAVLVADPCPVQLGANEQRLIATLSLRDTDPAAFQAELEAWAQAEREDVLTGPYFAAATGPRDSYGCLAGITVFFFTMVLLGILTSSPKWSTD